MTSPRENTKHSGYDLLEEATSNSIDFPTDVLPYSAIAANKLVFPSREQVCVICLTPDKEATSKYPECRVSCNVRGQCIVIPCSCIAHFRCLTRLLAEDWTSVGSLCPQCDTQIEKVRVVKYREINRDVAESWNERLQCAGFLEAYQVHGKVSEPVWIDEVGEDLTRLVHGVDPLVDTEKVGYFKDPDDAGSPTAKRIKR
ncbi:hypothetical protein EDC01DRAFT_759971 [Geopyxis carbonaria]|nr:hypothetical protein EDC01DRAFT_759971 [Geopyxis carbonaria]